MRRRAILAAVVLAAVPLGCGGGSSDDACARLRDHREAIQAQMDATTGNDDASIARYNELVAKSNRDFDELKSKGCALA